MKQVKQNANLTAYKGHLLMVLFLFCAHVFACMPAPVNIDFDKIKKSVTVEAAVYRPVFIKSSEEVIFEHSEYIETIKEKEGHYINVKKAGDYTIKIKSKNKEVLLNLKLHPMDQPRNRTMFSKSVPQSAPKEIAVAKKEYSGCGGVQKVKYD